MRVSFKILKEFVNIPETPEYVAKILTNLGLEVEEIFDFQTLYKNFVISQIVHCEKISNTNFFCLLSDGLVERKVVCGAPNISVGQKVVLALPGAVIPKTKTQIEPTIIRGFLSEGMICSEDELEIGNVSDSVIVLPDDAPIGVDFAKYIGFDDFIYEIGITPNRSDCLSHIGVARELSAYFGIPMNIPKIDVVEYDELDINKLVSVEILDKEKCPRYTARIIKDICVRESPIWLKSKLIRLGLRPINAIVDATNYVMMELGQPLHAFDYETISGKAIVVRTAEENEKFTTLDGKERILDSSMLMICDTEKPIAIGGVMGGENTEISSTTNTVLLESAFFDPTSIRKTSKKLGLTTESSYRFERGVDYENVVLALHRAASLIASLGNGKLVGGYIDIYPNKIPKKYVSIRFERANRVIGINLPREQMEETLARLGFSIENRKQDSTTFEVPPHRFDVEQEIDLIEEIARFYGYDNIPENRTFSIEYSSISTNLVLEVPPLREEFRRYFVSRGFTEFLTPNLYNPHKMSPFYSEKAIEIANPLGEELSIVRPSILPLMLESIAYNIRIGQRDLKVFEIGKEFVVNKNATKFIEGIEEREVLCLARTGLAKPLQWGEPIREVDFYDIHGDFRHFLSTFKLKEFEFSVSEVNSSVFGSESLSIRYKDEKVGEIGIVASSINKIFDIEQSIYIGYLFLDKIYSFERESPKFEKISPYPVVRRDLAFVLDESVTAEDITRIIWTYGGNCLRNVVLFDVYRGKKIGEGKKNLAFALFFNSDQKTLVDEEVDSWINTIVEQVREKTGGELRIF
ncbi:MAG: phenylalanine--tRNA ligase subunit beta [Ignavibacteria bacterium]|nr:phenylalanine--tRNA ligase subunit beta [Ignavibacteria bacterium]